MTRSCCLLLLLLALGVPGPGRARELPSDCSAANLEIAFSGSCRDLEMGAVPEVEGTNRAYGPPPAAGTGPFPLIVQLPGGGAAFDSTQWAALRLAETGYIVVNIDPSGAGTGTEAYAAAASATIDFLSDPNSSPYHPFIDFARIGSTGWSLGAHAQVLINNHEPRVGAVVAFDTLASTSEGDIGSQRACVLGQVPEGGQAAQPRVPALGFTVEACNNPPPGSTFERTTNGWRTWREAGIDSMLLTLDGGFANAEPSNHFWFSSIGPEQAHDVIARYTIDWFDHYLKGIDRSEALLACDDILGWTIEEILADQWASAVFFGGRASDDLRNECRTLEDGGPGGDDALPGGSFLIAGTGQGDAAARGVDFAANGEILVTGSFSGTLALDEQDELISAGNRDGLVLRLDPAGQVIWMRRFGGAGSDLGFNLDVAGNRIAVSGIFSEVVDFGGQSLVAGGAGGDLEFLGEDMFVAAYAGDGELLWVRHLTGPATIGGNEVAWMPDGGVVAIGNGFGTVGVAGSDLSTPNVGGQDAFVARFDANGNPIWLRSMGATGDDQGRAIAVGGQANVYFAGQFEGRWNDGSTEFQSVGAEDGLVVALDADGRLRWARQLSSIGTDRIRGLAVDGDRLLSVGEFSDTVMLDGQTLTSDGGRDVVLMELAVEDGRLLGWQHFGGADDDEGGEIEIRSDGSRVIAGNFRGTARFGPTTRTSAGARDLFVARLDADNNLRELYHGRSTMDAFAIDVAADAAALALAGNHEGSLEIVGRGTPEAGGTDLHVARIATRSQPRLVPVNATWLVIVLIAALALTAARPAAEIASRRW